MRLRPLAEAEECRAEASPLCECADVIDARAHRVTPMMITSNLTYCVPITPPPCPSGEPETPGSRGYPDQTLAMTRESRSDGLTRLAALSGTTIPGRVDGDRIRLGTARRFLRRSASRRLARS